MNTPPDGHYVPDPPTVHKVPEARMDRGTAKRRQLEENPDVRAWMADVLRANGWICYPPEVTAASESGPPLKWCETHQCNHVANDQCKPKPAPTEVAV